MITAARWTGKERSEHSLIDRILLLANPDLKLSGMAEEASSHKFEGQKAAEFEDKTLRYRAVKLNLR